MPTTDKRPLKVFLCHAHADRDAVRALYARLTNDGVDAWLDKEKLLPGQDWELEIKKAVREADVVVVCLSKQFNQAGFRQKEVRLALDTAMEKPEGEIFIIPARLEECDNLESLRKWHEVNLFEENGNQLLLRALTARADSIGCYVRVEELKKTEDSLLNAPVDTVVNGMNWEYVSPSDIFNYRLGDAFPGLRGVARFDGDNAVNRLEVLLRNPLKIDSARIGGQLFPFYWFRGIANNHVQEFERLSSDRVLLDIYEMKVDYVLAVRKFSGIKNFVYVQLSPETPTGLYNYKDGWLEEYLKSLFEEKSGCYFFEEYGVWGDKLITREEFDDGATIVDGKVVLFKDAILRARYITPFNFILCGSNHLLNTGFFDWDFTKLLDEVLLNEKSVESVVDFVGSLPKGTQYK